MDLKEFVSDVLVQVADGVVEAQGRSKTGTLINPPLLRDGEGYGVNEGARGPGLPQMIEFDVCITVEDAATLDGKGEIRVVAIGGVKGNAQKVHTRSHVSRVRFVVPVCWPLPVENK